MNIGMLIPPDSKEPRWNIQPWSALVVLYVPTCSSYFSESLPQISCGAEAKLQHAAEKQQQLVKELQDAQGKLREVLMKRQQPFMQQARAEHSSYHHRHGVAPS